MRFAFCVLIVLSSSPAIAGEMTLLAHYEFRGSRTPGGFQQQPLALERLSAEAEVPHLFVAGGRVSQVWMSIPAIPENDGKTFHVDPAEIAKFNTDPTGNRIAGFGARIGMPEPLESQAVLPYYFFDADEAFRSIRWVEVHADAYVPYRGQNFSGYDIDAVTVTTGWPMKIDVYGHAIPEPTILAMLLVCSAAGLLVRVGRK